jgi:hypothetical protein
MVAACDGICSWCSEPILPGERSIIPGMQLLHRECECRMVFGSVGHQKGRCTCHGGTEGDPLGLTKREAARAAWEFFRAQKHKTAP